jgi:hypothetical protein
VIKVDIKKQLKNLYNPSATTFAIVDVPRMNYVMVDGTGDPNTAKSYIEAIETLYTISFTLKFTVKREKGIDYGVMPLEGLWWTDDMTLFSNSNKNIWKWTSMIMQPEYISKELFDVAMKEAQKKKKLPALSKARFENFAEGLSGQIMYVGPYSDEGPTIEKLHQFLHDKGYKFDGVKQKHHEIYLGDPRRIAPEKLKTIIRQPVEK